MSRVADSRGFPRYSDSCQREDYLRPCRMLKASRASIKSGQGEKREEFTSLLAQPMISSSKGHHFGRPA